MKANELSAPAGASFSFEDVGDTLEGIVVYVGDFMTRTNKFNGNEEQVAKIGVAVNGGDEPAYIYPKKGSAMASAIADALRDGQLDELTEGQMLKLRFDSTKDTGKGNPLKLFRAKVSAADPSYTPPAPVDEEPF